MVYKIYNEIEMSFANVFVYNIELWATGYIGVMLVAYVKRLWCLQKAYG
jgi:hypothetical protein